MEYMYDAFISYRHAEVDSAVAKDIQHWLEHFHVPKSIQEASGKKKINRVFRDKEELPLSMNLGETITDALLHSEYLIVICSPRTKESQWVQREIDAFLETHDLEHILAVIAEGEPDDVIPKILTYKETTSLNENGEEITVKEDLEPLGCDYRVGKRKAHKEELPRLAASLLNCSYDDLIQRARQYRRRVLSAILAGTLALTLAFLGYVLHSNRQIRTNYENALRSQSEYLASESLKSLDDKDRFTAMALALEALPSETKERPYVAKAEYALGQAALAYLSLSDTGLNIIPSATYNVGADIRDLCAGEKSYIAVLDSSDTISVFDSKDNSHVKSFQIENTSNMIHLIGITPNNRFLFYAGSMVYCYSLPECKEAWRFDCRNQPGFSETTSPIIESALLSGKEVFVGVRENLFRLSADTGKVKKQYQLPEFPEGIKGLEKTEPGQVRTIAAIKGNKLPLLVGADMDDSYLFGMGSIPAILDLHSSEVTYYPQDDVDPHNVSITNNGDLIVYSIESGEESSDVFLGANRLFPTTNYISCIAPDSKEQLWVYEEESGQFLGDSEIRNLSFVNSDSTETDAVLITISNKALVIDSRKGSLLKKVEMPGSICGIGLNEKALNCVTREGYYGFSQYSFDPVYAVQYFQNPIDFGWVDSGLILVPGNQSVIRYNYNVHDDSFHPMGIDYPSNKSKEEIDTIFDNCLIEDDCIAFLDKNALYYSDGPLDQKLKYTDLSDYTEKDLKSILGRLSNGKCLIERSDYRSTPIIEFDPETGKAKPFDIPEVVNEDGRIGGKSFQLVGDTLFYSYYQAGVGEDYSKKHLYFSYLNDEDGKPVRIDLGVDKDVSDLSFSVSDDKQMAVVYVKDYYQKGPKAILVDLSDNSIQTIKVNTTNFEPNCAWNHSGDSSAVLAVNEGHSISVWDNSGKKMKEMADIEGSISGVNFMDDGSLLCVTNLGDKKGQLLHFDKDFSNVLHRVELPLPSTGEIVKWDYVEDHYLVLQSNYSARIIDVDQWQILAEVPAYGYQPKSDSFIYIDSYDDHYSFGYRKRYTTESLIKEAKRQLGDFKLSDKQRAEYGLD